MLDLKNSTYSDVRPHRRTLVHRFELWMINDGKRYLYLGLWILLQVLLFSLALVNYIHHPQWKNAHKLLGASFLTARSAALALHVDTGLVLLPICRIVISWIRTTPLNRIIPFDHATLFHIVIGYSIVFFTLVHTASHYHNYYLLAKATGASYAKILFTTGHSITGHIMLFCILIMAITGYEKMRRKHFNVFWNLHHLFAVYFVCFSIHGTFCLLKPNEPPYCHNGGTFWKYWLASGIIYLFERLAREFRANKRSNDMKVQKVILHPGKVIEVQFRKPRLFKGLAGQYVFLNCPAVSTQQWHPFTLTSAPEEDYVSVHIRVVGDWTRSFAQALGAQPDHWKTLEATLGEQNNEGGRKRAHSRAPQQQQQKPADGAARDSMAYAPIQRRPRKNTALSANRPGTMVLVDQGGQDFDFGNMPMMPNGVVPPNSNGFMSRISQYWGNAGPSASQRGSRTSSTFGNRRNNTQWMPMKDAEELPKMPTLKQLQDHYLREGDSQQGGEYIPMEQQHQQHQHQQQNRASDTRERTRAMKDLRSIVNDDLDYTVYNSNEPHITHHAQANILPQVLVDGPFGTASEDVFNHEIAMLFCAGIGCTPFASVLKSIWYRLSYPDGEFRLRKVYFFWVQRDTKSFEWFQDLLKAIEEEEDAKAQYTNNQADDSMIEIHTYLTGRLNMTQMEHVHLNDGELDPITGLKSPTNFGRPNMDLIFKAVAHEHPASDVGVFFCGPHKLGATIESAAKKWSSEGQDGTKFYYNKENF
ncbi:hypothetical protein GGI12_001426 [Dipsacomyces acuminosporus]|nr:hypothetical protein GGI12_001426 [Dipsacomyces acuminosporus]